jgi:nicotinate-nucleotide pyrophosphorylase (carboxylating)
MCEEPPYLLQHRHTQALIRQALEEDVGGGDVSSLAVLTDTDLGEGTLVARQDMVVAGLPVAEAVFHAIDPSLGLEGKVQDGSRVSSGDVLMLLQGRARGILTGERTALNFLQRLSGIATLTRGYVDAIAGTGAVILDTRKTTPGYRALEKYAVRCGGGQNHRMGLYDRIMLKDNHLAAWSARHPGGYAEMVQAARQAYPDLAVEVEVDTLEQLEEVLPGNPDWVLLDNMSPPQLEACVARTAGRIRLEASGGVTLDTVSAIASTGVDAVSVGALTHSAPACDIALDWCLVGMGGSR